MILTKTFTAEQYEDALTAWDWIPWRGKTPVLASLFGDVFLQDASGYWFLDTIEGSLSLTWSSRDELQAALDTEEGQDRFLLGGLAMAAGRAGLTLAPNEVYDVSPPPVLGGRLLVENLTKVDFVVSLHIAGSIHDQVRNLPPGARISGISVDGKLSVDPPTLAEDPSPKSRWGRRRGK